MQLDSNWTRKNDQRPCQHTQVETTIFADDTPLHGKNKNCTRAITWVCPAWIVLHKQECSSWHEVLVSKILPALKHTRLTLMTFVYSPLAFSCKTRATTQKNINRFQSVMNTAIRYVCNTRLSRMRDQGINHHDLGAKLGIPPISAAIAQEQMRWLGHIDTYSKTFGRGIP
jgi:hypothetical protein